MVEEIKALKEKGATIVFYYKYGGCKSSPPEAMICQICKRDSRFAPAIAMCPIEVHKDGIVDSDVVATMKDFLKTFDCGSLDAAIVVGRAPSKRIQ